MSKETATAHAPRTTEELQAAYARVRGRTLALAAPLSAEDACVQSMPEASPTKWHLAHTTWFFEQFLLGRDAGYEPVNRDWHFLFNSYYQSVGPMHARPHRGLLTRPSLDEVLRYRAIVDERMAALIAANDDAETVERVLKSPAPVCRLMEFGSDSVNLELRIWIADPQKGVANVQSDVLLNVWNLYHEYGVEFPFSQRDLHLKSAVPLSVQLVDKKNPDTDEG